MRHRRRHLAVLLGAVLATFVGLVPISSASAAPVTNACLSGATYSDVAISMSATATPGDPVTLSSTSVSLEVPGTLFLDGYRASALDAGDNTVPVTGTVTIAGSNTSEGTSSETVSVTSTVSVTDPTPDDRSNGDESATPVRVDLPLADTVWTPTGGSVAFSEASVVVDAGSVTLTCEPGTSSSDGSSFTPAAPAAFEAAVVPAQITSSTSSSTTSTTTPPQFLPSGSASLIYDCVGADPASQNLLNTIGLLSVPPIPAPVHLPLDVKLDTDPIPSPQQGQAFDLPLRWTMTLSSSIVSLAQGAGITSIAVSGISLTAGPTAGATGADTTANPPTQTIVLAQASGFSVGPFPASLTRTGGPGDPIVMTAKALLQTTTVVHPALGPIIINLACAAPASASITLVDALGETPSTTATTAPPAPVVAAVQATTTAAPAQTTTIPRTGVPALVQIGIALALLDLGYLAVSTRWSGRRRLRTPMT